MSRQATAALPQEFFHTTIDYIGTYIPVATVDRTGKPVTLAIVESVRHDSRHAKRHVRRHADGGLCP